MSMNKLFDLSGKVAIVTGGATGLGKQMAIALAEAGADVVVTGRRLELCSEVAKKLSNTYQSNSIAIQCDVTKEDQVDDLVENVSKKYGKIDILVNNAGQGYGALAENWPIEKWNHIINVNLTGCFICSQRVGQKMIQNKSGKIINISSIGGIASIPTFHSIGYTAAKGGLIAITKELATKWARHNILVNAIAPGFFPTDMSGPIIDFHGDKMIDAIPLKRLGREEEIKGPIVFLASDASDYITGHVLVVDGGQLAWAGGK